MHSLFFLERVFEGLFSRLILEVGFIGGLIENSINGLQTYFILHSEFIYFFPEFVLMGMVLGIFLMSAVGSGSEISQLSLVNTFYRLFVFAVSIMIGLVTVGFHALGIKGHIVSLGNFYMTYDLFLLKSLISTLVLSLFTYYKVSFERQFYSRILLEQAGLVFLLLFFGFLMVSSDHLLLMGIILCGLNVVCYVLIGQSKTQASIEAALKYFVVGMLLVFYFFFGCWMLWVEQGTLSLSELAVAQVPLSELSSFALILLVLALSIKLSTFPTYMWSIDVYDGSSSFIMALLVVVVKAVSFIAFLNVVLAFPIFHDVLIAPLLSAIGVASMTIGTFGAIRQQKIKRFLAYSSVNHMGFLFLLIASLGGLGGVHFIWFYLVFYLIGTAIFFSVLVGVRKANGRELTYLSELATVQHLRPEASLLLVFSLLSFAGIPPFIGFFAKYAVIYAAYSAGNIVGLVFLFSLMAFAAYNYLRVLKNMNFRLNFAPTLHFYFLWPTYGIGFLWIASYFLLTPFGFWVFSGLFI